MSHNTGNDKPSRGRPPKNPLPSMLTGATMQGGHAATPISQRAAPAARTQAFNPQMPEPSDTSDSSGPINLFSAPKKAKVPTLLDPPIPKAPVPALLRAPTPRHVQGQSALGQAPFPFLQAPFQNTLPTNDAASLQAELAQLKSQLEQTNKQLEQQKQQSAHQQPQQTQEVAGLEEELGEEDESESAADVLTGLFWSTLNDAGVKAKECQNIAETCMWLVQQHYEDIHELICRPTEELRKDEPRQKGVSDDDNIMSDHVEEEAELEAAVDGRAWNMLARKGQTPTKDSLVCPFCKVSSIFSNERNQRGHVLEYHIKMKGLGPDKIKVDKRYAAWIFIADKLEKVTYGWMEKQGFNVFTMEQFVKFYGKSSKSLGCEGMLG
ncbi:hypothetical protein LTR17_025783 [Elasticomyces elasticus]|nr:hypothetical protein LTR17_025783 [Elasticomyces elasticus]